jgi:hypothetical protein
MKLSAKDINPQPGIPIGGRGQILAVVSKSPGDNGKPFKVTSDKRIVCTFVVFF